MKMTREEVTLYLTEWLEEKTFLNVGYFGSGPTCGLNGAWLCCTATTAASSRQMAAGVFGGYVPEFGGKALRVVTLEDRITLHNAFPDSGEPRAEL